MRKFWIFALCALMLVGCGSKTKYEIADISDFDYNISGGDVKLESYDGSNRYLEIASTYEINGTNYKTDLSEFYIGSGPEMLVLSDGVTSINTAMFNGSDIKSVYFPKSMEYLYDYTLSYLHPDEGEKVNVYYAGTSVDWELLLTDYESESQSISEAWNSSDDPEEKGAAIGQAIADKLNGLFDGYDKNDFEFHFESTPDELKEEK